ncbi:MAG: bifunctional DNA primase/polymerase [Gammaproteobacteria bacterium]|nr:bifunctional DNA primase/polymerase [Gammaproteobacteria bacterium]
MPAKKIDSEESAAAHPASADVYIRHGWSLVPIPSGTKGPSAKGWNRKENALTSQASLPLGCGIGLAHAYSGTMALDIDDWFPASLTLATHGINLDALYAAPDAVIVDSGRAGHGKLLYAMPFGLILPSRKITNNGSTIYELRCGTANGFTVQDVLPPSIHPDTQQPYRWAGNGHWTRLPPIPGALLAVWTALIEQDRTRTIQTGEPLATSWEEVRSALWAISPDVDRETWIACGMALHWAGHQTQQVDAALTLWDEWSASSVTKYPGEREILTQWRSMRADKMTSRTLGTLFHHAREAGWVRAQPDAASLFGAVAGGDTQHPLLRFKSPISDNPTAPVFVVDGFICALLTVIAGMRGVGKTTLLLPLILVAAGICVPGCKVSARIRRKVIWVTEDIEQARRVVVSMRRSGISDTPEQWGEMLKLVPAVRIDIEAIVEVADAYSRMTTLNTSPSGGTYDAPPVVVFDTTNASIRVDNENDNAEIGKVVALLKERFTVKGIPVVLVGHTAKATYRADAEDLVMRGAGAWEADANQTAYVFMEKDSPDRFLRIGKNRFDASETELRFISTMTEIVMQNVLGELESVRVRHAVPTLMAPHERKLESRNRAEEAAQDGVVSYLQSVDWATRAMIKEVVRGNDKR